jgi:ribosomal protein S24E
MDIKIISQDVKKLLSREEYIADVKDSKTPSYENLRENLSKKLNKPAELIVIKRIKQQYGKHDVEAKFYIYNNAESLKKFENTKKSKEISGAPKS